MAAKKTINKDASNGLVTSRDPAALTAGELMEAVACEYRVGSPHLYKHPGRTSTGTALGSSILKITKLQYDAADDVLIADTGGVIYESESSVTPSFSASGVSGLSTTAIPQYTGMRDRWIRCNGVDENYLREFAAVPNGTEGSWRKVGMEVALSPTAFHAVSDTSGGHLLRPSTYTNRASETLFTNDDFGIGEAEDSTFILGYDTPAYAIDGYDGAGIGTVSGTSGSTTLTGVGTLFTKQLTAGASLTFADGTTATVLSISTDAQLLTSAALSATETDTTFTYTGSNSPYSAAGTGSTGYTGHNVHSNRNRSQRVAQCVWKFTSNLAYTGRTLSVLHYAVPSPAGQPLTGIKGMVVSLEYSTNAGVTYNPLGVGERFQTFPDPQGITDSQPIPDGLDISNLWIRSTVAIRPGTTDHDIYHVIRDISVSTGATTYYNATNTIYYGVSESYTDSDGVEHRSNMGPLLQIGATDIVSTISITLDLPPVANPLATKLLIWRSLDSADAGLDAMYLMDEVPSGVGQWTDLFTIRPDDSVAMAEKEQYPLIEILYSTGENTTANFYTKPPLSFMTLTFQGCLCYIPSEPANARRIYYSLPVTVSPNALEQVPEFYYLDFQTPFNDQVKSGAVTNGGRSMLAFFENYTMLVNYLPQGADPGGFNNTVKEFVSDVRGCAGARACVEFTLPVGQTLVGAVDALGLWVTNGVNQVDEWSEDLEWDTAMAGVDLSAVILVDKPQKRRLELMFTATDGTRQEYHFFYGRMKAGVRNQVPLITGPHPSGVSSKLYTVLDNAWRGFTGGASATGDIFIEDDGVVDEALGYNADGDIPFSFTIPDIYPEGITRANILEQVNFKFSDGSPKLYTINLTYMRDNGNSLELTKTYHSGTQQQIYCHRNLDRVRVQIQDISNTAASAFVGMALEFRDSGPTRNI